MAIEWSSPAELEKISSIYAAFVLVLAGIATWDVLSTLAFDWSIVSGRRKWRWPMLLYFIDRLAMLIHIYAYCVNLNAISYINCNTVVWMSKITDMIGTCTSTTILAFRTTAVWGQSKFVMPGLLALSAVQIILWGQTMRYSHSVWNPTRKVCQIEQTSPVPLLIGVWSYTMTLDFFILCLCSFKLWRARAYSGMSALLLRDGIGYFIAAFTSNLVQVILAGLRLNAIMNIIAVPFSLVVSVIAATTVFRNVFIKYDHFSGETSRSSHSNQAVATIGGTGRSGLSRARGNSASNNHVDTFALSSIKAVPHAAVEVHKVVDIERDAGYTGRQYKGHSIEDDDSFAEEKR